MTTKLAIAPKTPEAYNGPRVYQILHEVQTWANGGASNIEFLQSGTGAVATDLQTRGRLTVLSIDMITLVPALLTQP